jgi:acetylornithine deacetylase/succinyl-diaminopimelate desuccinylase-like protein
MIFVEEDSARNSELKKNLRVPPLTFDEETLTEIIKNLKTVRLDKVREVFDDQLEEDFQAANDSDNPLKGELSDAVAELFGFLVEEKKYKGCLVQVLPEEFDEKND